MSAAVVPIPQGAQVGDDSGTPSLPSSTTPSTGLQPIPQGAQVAEAEPSLDPAQTGQMVNDVGNTVIVPKAGESFQDTMKRAVAYHQSLTPEARQSAIDKEVKTMPAKTAQTLAAAASIGLVGPAMLAAPGEAAEAIPSVLAHTTEGVKAVTAWAAKNPVQAYMMFQVLKELIPGAKKAMGIIKGAPDTE